ncbi:MAG: bifunctional ornithine acetyltransferase/N-acetylglutamate synthase [Planctomycetota bacterium]|jgi:glutamate N-acetyltransferase/amino-acid N-acetyltransferase
MADRFSLDPTPAELADVDGFRTGAAASGLRSGGSDVGVILCEEGGCGTALFTQNASRAAPVQVSRPRALAGRLRGVVANSGNANCFTGEEGLGDARQMVLLASSGLDVPEEQLLVASVGAAGVPLPAEEVGRGIEDACADALGDGRGDFASVIAPAGAPRRTVSGSGTVGGKTFRIAGVTRGLDLSGTGMANVFAFVVTDAAVEPEFLTDAVDSAHAGSFGRLVVDAGVGTNDTLCVLCSGRAGNEPLGDLLSGGVFAEALGEVVAGLALDLAFDASGATRLIDVKVSGATSDEDAETVARAIAESTLVRIAVHAGRPGWELVLAAAGRSGARVVESRATVRLAGTIVYDRGRPAEHSPDALAEKLRAPRAAIELDLGLGEGAAGIFTCTLSDGAGAGAAAGRGSEDGGKAEDRDADAPAPAGGAPTGEAAEELAGLRAELAEKTERLDDIEWEHAKELREAKREAIEDAASADDIPAEMQKLVEDLEAELEKVRNSRKAGGAPGAGDAGASSGGGGGDGDAAALREELESLRADIEEKSEEIKDLEWQHAKELREAKRGGGEGNDDDASGGDSSELEARIAELQKDLEEAREQAKAAPGEGDASALREELEGVRAELEQARAELEAKNDEIKDLEWQHAKELREAKRGADGDDDSSSDEAAAEMKARIEELEKELDEARAAPAGSGGESNLELLEKINDLQAELEEAQAGADSSGDSSGGSSGYASGDDGAASEEVAALREELEKKDALIKEMEFKHVQALREARKQAAAEGELLGESSGESSGESAGDADGRVKQLETKLEKANAKLQKRAEKIAELREKIGEASAG